MSEETTEQKAVQKTFKVTCTDKTLTAHAESLAWTENGEFILLMDGDDVKHVIVAANVIAVTTEQT
jgi:hypothetical protein